VRVSRANLHDSKPAIEMLDAIAPVQGPRGRPRIRPDAFLGDRAYGTPDNLVDCYARGITPLLARPRTPNGSGLGKWRYVVERTLSWFGNFRRLKLCYEKTGTHFQAFHELAASLICARKLKLLT
jgi:transposase